jgi:hypothetical protein
MWAHFRRFAPETGLFGAPKAAREILSAFLISLQHGGE